MVANAKCLENCVCGKHISQKCPKGCVCERHSDRVRELSRSGSLDYWATLSDEQREIDRERRRENGKRLYTGIDNPFYGQQHSIETRQRIRQTVAALWQKPEYVQKQMEVRGRREAGPNLMELAAADWLSPLGFQFVGDGQLIIAGKCPDFWDGGTKLIELYGDYWHAGQDPQDRINLFKAAGYDCIVIWEHELATQFEETHERVLNFISKETL